MREVPLKEDQDPQKKGELHEMQKYYKRAFVGDWWTKREKPRGNGALKGEKR